MSTVSHFKSNLTKLRTWGVRGVINYLTNLCHLRQTRNFFILNAQKHGNDKPVFGYTLVGNFTQYASGSKTMRDFAFALKKADIPFQTYNLDTNPAIAPETLADILTPRADFNINRYDHIVSLASSVVPKTLKPNQSLIVFWEFESGLLSAYPELPSCSSVIAMSEFNARHFRNVLPNSVKVQKILYPFQSVSCTNEECRAIREKYGIKPLDFMVFFNFDFASSYYRKNPEGALFAFAEAFRATPATRLVFKTMHAKSFPKLVSRLELLARNQGIADRLLMINDYLSEREIFALSGTCDVYISLHRGEGFGITLAEAMSMERPVICTDYSSTTEFCHPDCTIPIPYKMVPVLPEQIDHPCYRNVTEWAEPDIQAAADALRRLYESPALRCDLGTRAKVSITSQFSSEEFRKSASEDQ